MTNMPRRARSPGPGEMRPLHFIFQLSQSQFAQRLGVSVETYRTWDSGRRPVPEAWLEQAQALVTIEDSRRLWSLRELTVELGVHVRTLRDAA